MCQGRCSLETLSLHKELRRSAARVGGPPMTAAPVRSGLEALQSRGLAQLRGRRVGLVSHAAAIDRAYRSAAECLHEAQGVELATLFGPEHGLAAVAQDLEGVASQRDALTGLPVVSLYGATVDSLVPTAEQLRGLDV